MKKRSIRHNIMKKRYKIVIDPFLDNEKIEYRTLIRREFYKKINKSYYLLFTYNDYLKGYILIGANFNLCGLEYKLKPYYEREMPFD